MDTHTHTPTTAPTRIEIYICSSCTNDYRSRRGYTCWSSIIIKKEARKEIEKCSIRASHIIRRFSSLPIPSVNSISALFSRRCPVRPWSLAIHITQLNRFQYIIDFDSIQSYSDSQFLWPIRRLCWLRSNVYGTPQSTHTHTYRTYTIMVSAKGIIYWKGSGFVRKVCRRHMWCGTATGLGPITCAIT